MPTFLFTDIEGSTSLWERMPEAMGRTLRVHDQLLSSAFESHGGKVFKTVGDAFCVVFEDSDRAVDAAMSAQRELSEAEWGETGPIRVRMSIHSGEAEQRGGDYFGPTLNRVARLLGVAHGGQTLMSDGSYDLLPASKIVGGDYEDLGAHRLKDLSAPLRVWQVGPGGFPPLKSLDLLPTNLPCQLTSFVGRGKDMSRTREMLKSARLVTLTGAGGTGKTRIAMQIGADLLDEFSDGVWLVSLAHVSAPELLISEVASSLNVREVSGKRLREAVLEHLRSRNSLLILDNCEHLLSASAEFTAEVLQKCSKVRVLATSREPLRISGEATFRLPSLSLPEPAVAPDLELFAEFESVKLFIDRATAVRHDFQLREENAVAVSSICRRLEGIPLAVELAAARVRAMPVQEIDRRLDNSFRLLTGGDRTALPRQQTLYALIDWSYQLLSDHEKLLFKRLAVFSDNWDLTAAEAICAYGAIETWDVLDLLTSLVDKSLVIYDDGRGEGRYRYLQTVSQYARERLEGDVEIQEVRKLHGEYYFALAKECQSKATGPEGPALLTRMVAEIENFRAALQWSLEQDSDIALEFAHSMTRYWLLRASVTEGCDFCRKALSRSVDRGDSLIRAEAEFTLGKLLTIYGHYAEGIERTIACGKIFQNLGKLGRLSECLGMEGSAYRFMGELSLAEDRYRESLRLAERENDQYLILIALNNFGDLAQIRNDYAKAADLQRRAIQIAEATGNRRMFAKGHFSLAIAVSKLGDTALAERYFNKSLQIANELGDLLGTANILEAIASFSELTERWDRASFIWGAAASLRNKISSPMSPMDQLTYEEEVANVKKQIGEVQFSEQFESGRNLPLQEVIAFALS